MRPLPLLNRVPRLYRPLSPGRSVRTPLPPSPLPRPFRPPPRLPCRLPRLRPRLSPNPPSAQVLGREHPPISRADSACRPGRSGRDGSVPQDLGGGSEGRRGEEGRRVDLWGTLSHIVALTTSNTISPPPPSCEHPAFSHYYLCSLSLFSVCSCRM